MTSSHLALPSLLCVWERQGHYTSCGFGFFLLKVSSWPGVDYVAQASLELSHYCFFKILNAYMWVHVCELQCPQRHLT